jgi:chromosome segregation ATPase
MARESYRREREEKRAKEQIEECVDNILAEIDWCENKITKLRGALRQARGQERRDLQTLLSIYTSRRENLNSSYKWCRQQIRDATIQPPKPDPKLGEIDFCEQELDVLQTQLRRARSEDHEDIKSLSRRYKKY